MTIRRGRPEDFSAVQALLLDAFRAYAQGLGKQDTDRDYTWVQTHLKAGDVRVLHHDDALVAVAILNFSNRDSVVLDTLGVAPDQHRQGFGAKLLQSVEREVFAMDRALSLHTVERYAQIVAFYQSNGYRISRTGPHPVADDGVTRVFLIKHPPKT